MGAASAIAGKRGGTTAAMLLGGAFALLALPSAVLAFTSRFDPQPEAENDAAIDGTFMPASVDPRLARSITVRALSRDRTFRFTPAAMPTRLDRSVTVAVRLNESAPASLLRGSMGQATGNGSGMLRIAPTAYSLGTARGYKNFAQNSAAAPQASKIAMPDLAAFAPSGAAKPSNRFSTHIEMEDKDKPGRSPGTFEGQDEALVDVAGSYRLTRNLNVTAGVRYQQERDRLVPVTDGRQDSQSVYVGTQFRF